MTLKINQYIVRHENNTIYKNNEPTRRLQENNLIKSVNNAPTTLHFNSAESPSPFLNNNINNNSLDYLALQIDDNHQPQVKSLLDLVDEIAREKYVVYKDYLHYGHNPQDHNDILVALKNLPGNSWFPEEIRTTMSKLTSAVDVLLSSLLSLEERDALQSDQLKQLVRREKLVQRLMGAVAILPDMLQLADQKIRETEHRHIKDTVINELISGAMRRVKGADAGATERALRLIVSSPYSEMADRLKLFAALQLANAFKPQLKSHRLALEQIEKTCKSARHWLNNYTSASSCHFPPPTDMLWAVRQLSARLEDLIPTLQMGYERRKPPALPGKRQEWLSESGIRASVPAKKISNTVRAGVKKTAETLRATHSKINNEGTTLFKISRKKAFLSQSEEQREICIRARQLAAPLINIAAELSQTAAMLKDAIQDAMHEKITLIPAPATVEQALETELHMLLDDTPDVRLIQAIDTARAMAKQLLNSPILPLPEKDEPQAYALCQLQHIVDEYAPELTCAALTLASTADRAQENISFPNLIGQLNRVSKSGTDVGSIFNNALEYVTGTALQSDKQWLNKLENEFRHHWHPITSLLSKVRRNYRLVQPAERTLHLQRSLQLTILPLLNQVEKLRIRCRQMEAALSLATKNEHLAADMMHSVAENLRHADLSLMQRCADNLKSIFSSNPVQLYTTGPDQAVPLMAEAVLLADIEAIQLAARTLKDAASLMLWSPQDAVVASTVVRMRTHLDTIYKDIKDVIEALTGCRLHNFSPEGMIARDMGEWVAQLQTEWAQSQIDTASLKQLNARLEKQVRLLSQTLATKCDPGGKRLSQRIAIAVSDALHGEMIWPATAEERLRQTKTHKEYALAWAEKRLTYAMLFNMVVYHTPAAMFSIDCLRNSLVSPLRIINLILTPISSTVTSRAMKKVKPGTLNNSQAISEYHSRIVFQTLFRAASTLAPQLLKTVVAGAIAYLGVAKGGDYWQEFLSRALSRLPADMCWAGSFAAIRPQGWTISHSGEQSGIASTYPQQPPHEPLRQETTPLINKLQRNRRENTSDGITESLLAKEVSYEAIESKLSSFNESINYNDLSDNFRKNTYFYGIKFILSQIENDDNLPESIREKAYLASLGAPLLVPADIYDCKLKDTFLIPDSPGAKTGLLVRVSANEPYCYISQGKDLPEDIKYDMPHNANQISYIDWGFEETEYPSGHEVFENLRNGTYSLDDYLNYYNPTSLDVSALASLLPETLEKDYKIRQKTPENRVLMTRAIAGSHIPDPGVRATPVEYHFEYSWDNLTSGEYLRSFATPFTLLSSEAQLIASSINGETIQETERHIHHAEYVGSWIDVTAGAVTSFTPAGWTLTLLQSTAGITADLTEGKKPDPLAVAGLVLGCIPGEKISAKIGKFSNIGGKVAKYGLMLGNKIIDLTMLGESIKQAVSSGEPLAIYQALLNSGMGVESSWKVVKEMSTRLNIGKKLEESAHLQQLQAIQNNAPRYSLRSDMPLRKFKIGHHEMLGKMTKNKLSISRDYGSIWEEGTKLHLLAYRLQNAGGRVRLCRPQPSENYQFTFSRVTEHHITLNKLNKMGIKKISFTSKIKTFDDGSAKVKKSNEFTITHSNFKINKIEAVPSEIITELILDMKIKTERILNLAKKYTGSDKKSVYNNIDVMWRGLADLTNELQAREHSFDIDIFFLVKKNVEIGDKNNLFGLTSIFFESEKSNMEIKFLTAHPYTIINRHPEFKNYIIKNKFLSEVDLAQYNIKNVARYLGKKALHAQLEFYESIPSVKVKTLSFSGANPVTQKLGFEIERVSHVSAN